jgi:hypothetical protein
VGSTTVTTRCQYATHLAGTNWFNITERWRLNIREEAFNQRAPPAYPDARFGTPHYRFQCETAPRAFAETLTDERSAALSQEILTTAIEVHA